MVASVIEDKVSIILGSPSKIYIPTFKRCVYCIDQICYTNPRHKVVVRRFGVRSLIGDWWLVMNDWHGIPALEHCNVCRLTCSSQLDVSLDFRVLVVESYAHL
jgi:hypothetical protein